MASRKSRNIYLKKKIERHDSDFRGIRRTSIQRQYYHAEFKQYKMI